MRVIRHEWYNVGGTDEFRIVPLGDIHLGARGCDEKLLAATIEEIATDPRCYWIGMGDYCDFINRADRRFDPLVVADWLQVRHLGDITKAQLERLLGYLKPIASKCLGLLYGNHEHTIHHRYERDIYSDIVTGIKEAGGWTAERKLMLGYSGWLQLAFYWGGNRQGGSRVLTATAHHGASGGKLEGGKALNMQRWLWVHDCDLALMGHAHNTQSQAQDGVGLSKTGKPICTTRKGAFCGTFLGEPIEGDPYYERAGYYHAPVGTIRVTLHPGAKRQPERVRLTV